MTLVLVRKLLRDARWPLLVVCLLLFAFSAFWVKIAQRVTTEIAPFFDAIAKAGQISQEAIEAVIFKGPGKVSQAVLGGAEMRFERPTDFLAVELLHPVVILLTSLWAVSRAGGAVAGELDKGTMELLLSQPVPRNRLVLAHLTVDMLVIPAICLSVLAGTQFGLWAVGPFTVDTTAIKKLPLQFQMMVPSNPAPLPVEVSGQKWGVLNLAGLMFALSGVTMAVSAVNRSRWRALGWGALLAVGMFVGNVVGQLWDAAGWVRPATLFYYYQPQRVWLKNQWTVNLGDAWPGATAEVPALAVLLGVGAVGYLVALWVFTRRDLPAPL